MPDWVLDTHIKNDRGEEPKIVKKNQFLVWKFCKTPDKINWGREIKLAVELFKKYPDIEFWNDIKLGFFLNSLAWFKTDKGKEFLELQAKKMVLDLPETQPVELQENIISFKPPEPFRKKTVMDFIK